MGHIDSTLYIQGVNEMSITESSGSSLEIELVTLSLAEYSRSQRLDCRIYIVGSHTCRVTDSIDVPIHLPGMLFNNFLRVCRTILKVVEWISIA